MMTKIRTLLMGATIVLNKKTGLASKGITHASSTVEMESFNHQKYVMMGQMMSLAAIQIAQLLLMLGLALLDHQILMLFVNQHVEMEKEPAMKTVTTEKSQAKVNVKLVANQEQKLDFLVAKGLQLQLTFVSFVETDTKVPPKLVMMETQIT